MTIPVYLEVGSRRVFASAIAWPGWTRAGKTEADALAALEAYAPRYAPVAKKAGLALPAVRAGSFKVMERVKGNATTEFGAPAMAATVDSEPMTKAKAERICALLEASWLTFEGVAAKAPASLRKGPRGGGRDRDKMVEHVLGADAGYQRQIGLRMRQPAAGDTRAIKEFRGAILEAIRGTAGKGTPADMKWAPAYAVRRIAWHALDHAWEIEDRS